MLTWIPIVGPIIQGIVDIVKGQQDTTVKRYQEDTKRLGKETDADVSVIQTRAAFGIATNSIGTTLMRDIVMYPVAVHTLLIYWDAIFASHPAFVFGVKTAPQELMYIPYAVIAYLFVTAYRGPR